MPCVTEPAAPYGVFIFISQVSGHISAGGGLIPDNMVEMRIAFRRDWIQRKGSPENMSLIRVAGDSMEPTLHSGDIVLIDHSRDYVDPHGGIYAIVM
jgi:phage repressor protein C with HTH and peptisase S24 domain